MYGHATKVALGKTSATTLRLEFLSCDIKPFIGLLGGDGSEIRKGRSRPQNARTSGLRGASGSLTFEARADDLDLILELCMGTAIASDIVVLAETLPEFWVAVKYGTVDDVLYSGGKVNRATFRSQTGGKLTITLELEFEDYDDTATFPADNTLTLSSKIPYAHHQSVFTLDVQGGSSATTYKSPEWELVIDNMLDTGRYENSNVRVDIEETDRAVSMRGNLPFTAAVKSEFGAAIRVGLVGSLVYTNGSDSLTFAMASMQWPFEGPTIGGKNAEVRLPCAFDCVETDSAKELVSTNVSA